MSRLTVISQAVAYEDVGASSNPTQKPIGWARTVSNLPVENPGTQSLQVPPLSTATVFDGTRSTSIASNTAFNLTLSPADSTRYRITHVSGTAPAFRTARSVNLSATTVTLLVNQNLTVTVTVLAGTPFTGVQVGDTVLIPGVTTGDPTSPFNSLNEGLWTVLSRSNSSLVIVRPSGSVFSGIGESVVNPTTSQFLVYSATGVQVGDTVEIAAGFASTTLHSYEVLAVTPEWIEFQSTSPLGEEAGITPGTTGLVFYTSSKRWLRMECDQECVVRMNGATDNSNRVEPVIPGNKDFIGWHEKFGSVWSLVVVNRSTAVLNLVVMSAE
jgi:hypothetical protein